MNKEKPSFVPALTVAAFVLAVMLAGCSTLSRAVFQLTTGLTTDSSSNTGSSGTSGSQTTADSSQPSRSAPGFSPMQMQFYSIYAVSAPFGGYKTGGSKYKPGQGTIWELSGKNRADVTTIEHALLKSNTDGSQWWRVQLTTGNDNLLYEFLVAPDETISKVRYKDPDTGTIVEFVPDASRSAAQSPYGPGGTPPQSAGSPGKVTTDHVTVAVRAGRFPSDHTTFVDDKQGYKSETWLSPDVPGGMIKYLSVNLKSGDTAQGELIKIESGVTTVLGSY